LVKTWKVPERFKGYAPAQAMFVRPNAEVVWVQDEPENQGAWPFISLELVKWAKLAKEANLKAEQ